jgi:hypothetical protein
VENIHAPDLRIRFFHIRNYKACQKKALICVCANICANFGKNLRKLFFFLIFGPFFLNFKLVNHFFSLISIEWKIKSKIFDVHSISSLKFQHKSALTITRPWIFWNWLYLEISLFSSQYEESIHAPKNYCCFFLLLFFSVFRLICEISWPLLSMFSNYQCYLRNQCCHCFQFYSFFFAWYRFKNYLCCCRVE